MISALWSWTSTDLNLLIDSSKVYFSSLTTVHNSLANTVGCPPTGTTSVFETLVGDFYSTLSRPHPAIHLGRVATMDCHISDAWTGARKAHDSQLNAVAASSSPGSNGTVSDGYPLTGEARSNFVLMDSRTQGLRTVGQFANAVGPGEESHGCPSFVASGSGASVVRSNEAIPQHSCADLSEGRRRVGEILVRCGVLNNSGSAAIGCSNTSNPRPLDTPTIFRMASGLSCGENDKRLIIALADWTSNWVHALVIQPYIGRFRFQYQRASGSSVALRIRQMLYFVCNPLQVAIHALWFISILAKDNVPFLSIPIFRYLHNNGTFFAEDFMFRVFVTCAMISDKSVNDTTLSQKTWKRLSSIPQAILSAMERHTLECLRWNVLMTWDQWEKNIIYLRSCIKMGSAFDPFGYDKASPSAIMACCLDELINLSYVDEIRNTSWQSKPAMEILAPQPVRHFTHWRIFDTESWCPEDDPIVNQKPRIVGIAPGADQGPKVGMTAKDLLDSILGSSDPDFAHSNFGAIRARRLVQTVKLVPNSCH